MTLYYGITIWFFILLLLGLRPDAARVAEAWPDPPQDAAARRNRDVVNLLALFSLLALWFLTAFRSEAIGNDTGAFLDYFDRFSRGIDLSAKTEPGYQLLNYLIGRITPDHHAFLIIMAALIYGGAGLYLFKYAHNTAVSACLFFALFFSPFVAMYRQGIAMVIALYGYQLLKNGKRIPAALVFLLATSFHVSALVCFLLFFDLSILQKRWFVFLTAALCAVLAGSGALREAVELVLPRYAHYFESRYASTGWLAVSYYLISYLVLYFFVSGSVIPGNRPDRTTAAAFAFLVFFAAFGYAVNVFTRAGEYFLLIAVTEFPNMMYRKKIANYRFWLLAACSVFLLMFLATLLFRPGWNHLYPYEFWQGASAAAHGVS
jgi:hypothetical protein